MKTKYSVKLLCELLDVSRSGYYKWLKRKDTPNRYEQDRAILTELLQDAHEKHPSYGYHRLAQSVRNETGWLFSHNLAHKCCKHAGIYSLARKHRKYRKPGEESMKFPNIVRGRWRDKERPVLVNSWEASYMNFNEKSLLKLAKEAANLGIELFVLDDGWFGQRDDDKKSLGDWHENRRKLPKLRPYKMDRNRR